MNLLPFAGTERLRADDFATPGFRTVRLLTSNVLPAPGPENRKERGCVLVAQKPRIGFLAAISNHLALRGSPARSAPEGRIPNHPPLAGLAADSGHGTSLPTDDARCAKRLPIVCSTVNAFAPWR